MGLAQGKSCGPLQPCLVKNASGLGGGGGGGGGGSPCVGPSRASVRYLAALGSRVHFPGLDITPSDIIRFPPRVVGLFRTQRAHACNHF